MATRRPKLKVKPNIGRRPPRPTPAAANAEKESDNNAEKAALTVEKPNSQVKAPATTVPIETATSAGGDVGTAPVHKSSQSADGRASSTASVPPDKVTVTDAPAKEVIHPPPAVQRVVTPPRPKPKQRLTSPPPPPTPPPATTTTTRAATTATRSETSSTPPVRSPPAPHPPKTIPTKVAAAKFAASSSSSSSKHVEKTEEKKPKRSFRRTKPLDEAVDATKLKMRDLIYLNPTGNRMKEYIDNESMAPIGSAAAAAAAASPAAASTEPVAGTTPTPSTSAPGSIMGSPREGESAPGSVVASPRPEEEEEEEDDSTEAIPVPQVTIGEDGKIVIKESSLTVAGPDVQPTLDEDLHIGSKTMEDKIGYGKRQKLKPWSRRETKKFYIALSSIGTDFSLMTHLFPNRDRTQLKRKFKLEDKKYRNLVDKALSQRKEFDMALFDDISSEEEEEVVKKRAPRKPKTQKAVAEEAIKEGQEKKSKGKRTTAGKGKKSSKTSEPKSKAIIEESDDSDIEPVMKKRKKGCVYEFNTTDEEEEDADVSKTTSQSSEADKTSDDVSRPPAMCSPPRVPLPPVSTLFHPTSPLRSPPPMPPGTSSSDPLSLNPQKYLSNINPAKIQPGQFVFIRHTDKEKETAAAEKSTEKEEQQKRIHVYMVSSPPGASSSESPAGGTEFASLRFGSPRRPPISDVFGKTFGGGDSPIKSPDRRVEKAPVDTSRSETVVETPQKSSSDRSETVVQTKTSSEAEKDMEITEIGSENDETERTEEESSEKGSEETEESSEQEEEKTESERPESSLDRQSIRSDEQESDQDHMDEDTTESRQTTEAEIETESDKQQQELNTQIQKKTAASDQYTSIISDDEDTEDSEDDVEIMDAPVPPVSPKKPSTTSPHSKQQSQSVSLPKSPKSSSVTSLQKSQEDPGEKSQEIAAPSSNISPIKPPKMRGRKIKVAPNVGAARRGRDVASQKAEPVNTPRSQRSSSATVEKSRGELSTASLEKSPKRLAVTQDKGTDKSQSALPEKTTSPKRSGMAESGNESSTVTKKVPRLSTSLKKNLPRNRAMEESENTQETPVPPPPKSSSPPVMDLEALKESVKSSNVVVRHSDAITLDDDEEDGAVVIQAISDDEEIPQGSAVLDFQVPLASPADTKPKVVLSDEESIDVGEENSVPSRRISTPEMSSTEESQDSEKSSSKDSDEVIDVDGEDEDDDISQLDGMDEVISVASAGEEASPGVSKETGGETLKNKPETEGTARELEQTPGRLRKSGVTARPNQNVAEPKPTPSFVRQDGTSLKEKSASDRMVAKLDLLFTQNFQSKSKPKQRGVSAIHQAVISACSGVDASKPASAKKDVDEMPKEDKTRKALNSQNTGDITAAESPNMDTVRQRKEKEREEQERKEQERKEKAEQKKREREENKRKEREEQERKEKEEQERKDKEEQERKEREEQERKEREEQERKDKEEQERKDKEEQERKELERREKEREEQERKDEEQERKDREEKENQRREEEKREKERFERKTSEISQDRSNTQTPNNLWETESENPTDTESNGLLEKVQACIKRLQSQVERIIESAAESTDTEAPNEVNDNENSKGEPEENLQELAGLSCKISPVKPPRMRGRKIKIAPNVNTARQGRNVASRKGEKTEQKKPDCSKPAPRFGRNLKRKSSLIASASIEASVESAINVSAKNIRDSLSKESNIEEDVCIVSTMPPKCPDQEDMDEDACVIVDESFSQPDSVSIKRLKTENVESKDNERREREKAEEKEREREKAEEKEREREQEAERIRAEKEREEQERRLEDERRENERLEKEREERLEQERTKERLENEQREKEKLEKERREKEKLEEERKQQRLREIEQERLEKEQREEEARKIQEEAQREHERSLEEEKKRELEKCREEERQREYARRLEEEKERELERQIREERQLEHERQLQEEMEKQDRRIQEDRQKILQKQREDQERKEQFERQHRAASILNSSRQSLPELSNIPPKPKPSAFKPVFVSPPAKAPKNPKVQEYVQRTLFGGGAIGNYGSNQGSSNSGPAVSQTMNGLVLMREESFKRYGQRLAQRPMVNSAGNRTQRQVDLSNQRIKHVSAGPTVSQNSSRNFVHSPAFSHTSSPGSRTSSRNLVQSPQFSHTSSPGSVHSGRSLTSPVDFSPARSNQGSALSPVETVSQSFERTRGPGVANQPDFVSQRPRVDPRRDLPSPDIFSDEYSQVMSQPMRQTSSSRRNSMDNVSQAFPREAPRNQPQLSSPREIQPQQPGGITRPLPRRTYSRASPYNSRTNTNVWREVTQRPMKSVAASTISSPPVYRTPIPPSSSPRLMAAQTHEVKQEAKPLPYFHRKENEKEYTIRTVIKDGQLVCVVEDC